MNIDFESFFCKGLNLSLSIVVTLPSNSLESMKLIFLNMGIELNSYLMYEKKQITFKQVGDYYTNYYIKNNRLQHYLGKRHQNQHRQFS